MGQPLAGEKRQLDRGSGGSGCDSGCSCFLCLCLDLPVLLHSFRRPSSLGKVLLWEDSEMMKDHLPPVVLGTLYSREPPRQTTEIVLLTRIGVVSGC